MSLSVKVQDDFSKTPGLLLYFFLQSAIHKVTRSIFLVNHIELFAGCGGLSLGLEQAGFDLVLANELSPMAAETFAYNFFNEDLADLAEQNKMPERTFWLNSQHETLKPRLRENPQSFPEYNGLGHSDIPLNKGLEGLNGGLLIGSVVELNKLLDNNRDLVHQLRHAFGRDGGLSLVSGGPPCQSFSLAGKRDKSCTRNTLPWEFAKFVEHTQPKIALLENVTGILRPFMDDDGKQYHAWYEVAKVFASIGYVPLCLHINARQAGVAQNRPRFIMISVHRTHFDSLKSELASVFTQSLAFYEQVQDVIVGQKKDLPFGLLSYIDSTKPDGYRIFRESFLNPLVDVEQEVSVKEALDDLKINHPAEPSAFINQLNATFLSLKKRRSVMNHEFRNNGSLVQRRFRLYQVLQQINDREIKKAVFSVLKGESITIPNPVWNRLKEYSYLHENGTLAAFHNKHDFERYLHAHPTKKQAQRALLAEQPTPTALTIPDDVCHYDEHELRVLTVREMARIQSFPDNFVFRSKVTTGGKMRKFEVPQYTQVGNAVPPILGMKLGKVISHLL